MKNLAFLFKFEFDFKLFHRPSRAPADESEEPVWPGSSARRRSFFSTHVHKVHSGSEFTLPVFSESIVPNYPAPGWMKIWVFLIGSGIRNQLLQIETMKKSPPLFCLSQFPSHLLGKRGDVIVEGLGGAHVAVIGHAGEVGVGREGGGVSGRAGGQLALFKY